MFRKIILKYKVVKEILIYKFNENVLRYIVKKPEVETMDETLDRLIGGCSISRFGDGEIDIILGRKQGFQDIDKKLAKRLKEIIKFNGKDDHFIIGIPNIFDSLDDFNEEARLHWQIRLNSERYKWYGLLNRKNKYGNSQVTRFYFDWKEKNLSENWLNKLKLIWDNKDLLIVEGSKSRLGIGNNLFDNSNSIIRILCPNENAFNKYDKILEEASKHGRNKLVLLALGPTASVLAYDLYLKGFHVIDIGHVDIEYEWFIRKTLTKVPIKDKYVNEVSNGNKVGDISSNLYRKQIVSIIE